MKRDCFCMIVLVFLSLQLAAQKNAVITEFKKEYVTYPFSDPNPVPSFGKIYPYFRFDGFTATSIRKKWKVVQLENDFIRIEVFPEIGGKVWSAYDKVHKRYFLYNNNVVKFRDIAMRGPWTSGGVEFNYGIIGHTPNTATPVDYKLETGVDGSVRCIIGCLEMLTRTRWNVEIKLEKDKAFFTTRSFWFNATATEQPYYQWSNSAVYAKNDLQLIYPGTAAIGHSGDVVQWPYDSVAGKAVDQWKENNYGGSKSFHIINSGKPYFGAHWKDEDFGMLHYTAGDEKLGRKMFSWALSDQGDIWKELLTDKDGQYVEMQSGRLFNQNSIPSSLTPFKQTQFIPYGTDQWTEYWYPFAGTRGVTDANVLGVAGISGAELRLSPLAFVKDTLYIRDRNGSLLFAQWAELQPLATKIFQTGLSAAQWKEAAIYLAGQVWTVDDKALQRPLTAPADFNWDTEYGLYVYARDLAGLKNYPEAEVKVRQALDKNKNYVPALALLSQLLYSRMQYDSAFDIAKRALSVDTYDAAANYYYALAALKTNRINDAIDGFNVAALTSAFRSAACAGLSRIFFIQKDYTRSLEYAEKSLLNNRQNMEALQLQYLVNRIKGNENAAVEKMIREAEPLNMFLLFENHRRNEGAATVKALEAPVQNEFPSQTYLELAIWYYQLGCVEEATQLLSLAPDNNEIQYWRAYLNRDQPAGANFLKQAVDADPGFVFPFREESKPVFDWAIAQTKNWKPVYLLALLQLSKNNRNEARRLLNGITDVQGFAPFYIVRASMHEDTALQEQDLQQAMKADNGWRYKNYLTRYYLAAGAYKKALEVIRPYCQKHPEDYINGMLYVRALIRNNHYEQADEVLGKLRILPFEGAGEGRRLYEEIKLMRALDALGRKKYTSALGYIDAAMQWPRTMGVGKPYEALVDNRLEQFFKGITQIAMKNKPKGSELLQEMAGTDKAVNATGTLAQVAALAWLNRKEAAETLFEKWTSGQKKTELVNWGKRFLNAPLEPEKLDTDLYRQLVKRITETEDKRLF
ncbi:DUF5107 domain-containing protein [Niabella beijingensis]|uniref:DUF5107 domain-containing protein n=1 Tax=Niabella beijingensis TaxID=2872700 RepID=UPI001CBE663B|nr:DUF5107 domain-containing protein [Niabella beijingensis]MBZ4187580.1 DUF5107 domain-containing protein [Niabella beijingensis]